MKNNTYGDENPVSVVFAHFNPGDQVTEITEY